MTTTTGSIDAKLTIDKSAWDHKRDEAKAEARELGELSPTIKVDANVGPALAKLEAVAKAERNLENSYMRSTIAQEKLDAVTKKYGDDSIQAASARLTLKRAVDAESDAEAKLAAAKSKSTEEQDKNTGAVNRAHEANRRHTSGLQVLLALTPALLGPTAAVGAAAVGLAVGFGAMGVAGIAAIKGIKDAMQVGDSVGNQYAAGLVSLKDNFNALAGTSANHMLAGFNQAVGDINSRMPFLNQLLGNSAGLLGQMGGTALRGVLDGLEKMNTLTMAGGVELGKFVTWLFSFTNANGFQQFISYAMDNLPGVMHLIENLVTTAGHILAAFAPLGPVVIGFLNLLTDGLNALPLPVLAGLVTTALTVAPALRIAGAAMGLFAIQSQLAVPVVGILTAALAGIGIAIATATLGTEQGTQAFRDYTQAIKDDNEALGEHVRLQASKAAADAGAFDAARELGISQKALIDALMGVSGAQETVNAAVKRGRDFQYDASLQIMDYNSGVSVATAEQTRMGKSIDTVTGFLKSNASSIERSKQLNTDIAAANDTTTASMSRQLTVDQQLAAQHGISVAAYDAAQKSQQGSAAALAKTTAEMFVQNNAAGLLKQTLDLLNGKTLSAEQAQNTFDSALANMSTHMDATGKTINRADTLLEGMTASAVKNRGELITLTQAAQANAQAFRDNGGSAEDTRQKLIDMKQAIYDNAVAHGEDAAQVQAYLDKIFKIPASIPPTKIEVDTAFAEAQLEALTRRRTTYLDIVENRIQSSTQDPGGTGSSIGGRANGSLAGGAETGGLIHPGFSASSPAYLADGGAPFIPRGTDTVPAMLTPGEVVIKRASVQSLGLGNLLQANRTGQWPQQQQAPVMMLPPNVTVYIGNEAVDSRMVRIVQDGIDAANRDAMRRPSR